MSTALIMETLNDLLFVEKKLVTYKWLSSNFKIHINEAKSILEEFLDSKKAANAELNAIYYLSGYENYDSTKILKVKLVRDVDLEERKSKLADLLSCHIYSLQSFHVKDLATVFLANDNESVGIVEQAAIKFTGLHLREAKTENKENAVKQVDEEEKTEVKKSATPKKKVTPVKLNKKSTPPKKGKSTTPKKTNSIEAMFSSMDAKNTDKRKMVEEEPEVATITKESTPTKVEKQKAAKKETTSKKSAVDKKAKSKNEPKAKKKFIDDEEEDEDVAPSTQNVLKNSDIFSADSSPEKTPVKKAKMEDSSSIRRSPRNHVSSSTSTFSSKRGKKLIDDDDDEEVVPPTPPVTQPQTYTKQKQVHKTYMDEDGYLVTTKESVKETVNEKPKTPKKNEGSGTPTKKKLKANEDSSQGSNKGKKGKTSPGAKKQASLTSFFKK